MRPPTTAAIILLAAALTLAAGAAGQGTPNDLCPLTPAAPESAGHSAVINNGTVQLGVNNEGHLNVSGSGVRFLPTGLEAIWVGCLCEGWGVADAVGGVTGWASISTGGVVNTALVSFNSTASTATSVVTVGNTFRVTHDFKPSPATPFLYEIQVTIDNISGFPVGDLRYTRGMDWDVTPTPFNEFVTIQGALAEPTVLYSDNNGFQIVNPLSPRGSLGAVGDFVDFGPRDHGAHFDFGFGPLPVGASRTFSIFYGAADNEVNALAAIAAVGATVYSFGQPNVPGGPDLGIPTTFIFAYRPLIEVVIDIKPGSDPNAVNPRSKGLIPVAILTTSTADGDPLDFDAWDVDPLSLAFGPNGAGIAHSNTHAEDVDGDGDLDMVAHFKTQNTGIACGDTEATLTGLTLGGQPIEGTDAIKTSGCTSGSARALVLALGTAPSDPVADRAERRALRREARKQARLERRLEKRRMR